MVRASTMVKLGSLLVLCIMGCTKPRHDVAVSELIGVYERTTKSGLEELAILSDGTYTHTLFGGTKARTQKGGWSVTRVKDVTWVSVSGFDSSAWPADLPGAGQVLNASAVA